MTTLRTAAQQALEALEFSTLDAFMLAPISPGRESTIKAITALRAALAEPERKYLCSETGELCSVCKESCMAEPVQEPVAWMIYTEGGTSAYVTDNPNDLVGAYRALALHTAPPQRKPLTEEEILSVLRLAPPEPSLWPHLKDEAVVGDVQKAVLAIARAIERAHGIGENDG